VGGKKKKEGKQKKKREAPQKKDKRKGEKKIQPIDEP